MARLGLRTLRKPNTDGFIEEIKNETEISIHLTNFDNLVQSSSTHGSNNAVHGSPHSSVMVQSSSTHGSNNAVHGSPHSSVMVQSSSTHGSKFDLDSITEPQRKLLYFLYLDLKENRAQITRPYKAEKIAEIAGCKIDGIRTIIKRFRKKEYLKLESFKDSGSGWSKYSLSEAVYNQIKLNENWFQKNDIMVHSWFTHGSRPSSGPSSNAPYSSSNDFDKKNTITTGAEVLTIPENLRRFGISTVNLQNLINSGKATQEVIERSLGALSFDVENGKTGNLANIFFGVLGTGREYISQKYSETLQIELDSEIARIKDTEEIEKKLQETKLQMKFKEYLEQNPEFLESVKNRHKTFVNSPSVLEKVAFEEFKALPEPI